MSKRRAGAGGVTPPPPDPATARAATLQVYADSIKRGITTSPEIHADVQDTLEALGLIPPARRLGPDPEPAAASRQAAKPAEPLPDVLTPRHATAVARAAHRGGQPVPERAARVLNHHRRGNRSGATP